MNQKIQKISVNQLKRISPVIAVSLIAGVLMAGFLLVPMDVFQNPPTGQVISLVMAGMAGICFVLSMIIPGLIARTTLSSQDSVEDSTYAGVYQTELIIKLALLEGPAFANLVALSQERNPWSLGIVVWLILTMIIFFPTPGRIDVWIKQKKELAIFEQQDAD